MDWRARKDPPAAIAGENSGIRACLEAVLEGQHDIQADVDLWGLATTVVEADVRDLDVVQSR